MARHQKRLSKAIKKFFHYDKEERIFILYLMILAIFILFVPVVSIADIGSNETSSFLLRNNSMLLKSAFVVMVAAGALIARNVSPKFRNIVAVAFGFKENPFLLSFALLWIILTSYVSVGDGIKIAMEATSRVSLTKGYFLMQFLLLVGLVFTLYMTLQQAKGMKK